MGTGALVLAVKDLDDQLLQSFPFEWVVKGEKLVEHAAQAPDIAFAVIFLLAADFRAERVRSTDGCLAALHRARQDARDTKIAEFGGSRGRHEDVLRFEITVENLAVVAVL